MNAELDDCTWSAENGHHTLDMSERDARCLPFAAEHRAPRSSPTRCRLLRLPRREVRVHTLSPSNSPTERNWEISHLAIKGATGPLKWFCLEVEHYPHGGNECHSAQSIEAMENYSRKVLGRRSNTRACSICVHPSVQALQAKMAQALNINTMYLHVTGFRWKHNSAFE
jgi:hypothetical protein